MSFLMEKGKKLTGGQLLLCWVALLLIPYAAATVLGVLCHFLFKWAAATFVFVCMHVIWAAAMAVGVVLTVGFGRNPKGRMTAWQLLLLWVAFLLTAYANVWVSGVIFDAWFKWYDGVLAIAVSLIAFFAVHIGLGVFETVMFARKRKG